jgi:hypothetical protein
MTQLRRGFRFTQESGADFSAKGELRRQHLDCDRALEATIARLVDDSHAASPDLAVELVRRRQDFLDVRTQVWVCRGADWLGHAVGLAGYDDGAVE